jgi:hypothetical protein
MLHAHRHGFDGDVSKRTLVWSVSSRGEAGSWQSSHHGNPENGDGGIGVRLRSVVDLRQRRNSCRPRAGLGLADSLHVCWMFALDVQ